MVSIPLKLVFTLAAIGGLTWFAGINEDSGRAAVALVVILWIIWFLNNQSKLPAFTAKIGG
jgi:hypothetical protein